MPYFSATGMVDRDAAPALFTRDFDVIWAQRNELAGVTLAQYFQKEMKESGLTHTITSVTSQLALPHESSDTAALTYFTPAPGLPKTIVLITYRAGIRVTETAVLADRYDKIMGMVSGGIKAAGRLDEYMRAAIFDGGFTGTAGSDSLPLCSNSHPHENLEAGTYDNLGTGALTGPNLHVLRLLARRMTDPQGDPDWRVANGVLIPPELEEDAMVLVTSDGKPGGDLNDPNVLIKGLPLTVSPYLSNTDQYFLTTEEADYDKGLHEVVLQDWRAADNSPVSASIVFDKEIKATKAFAFTRTKSIFGSTGV